jgi:KilA-N domain
MKKKTLYVQDIDVAIVSKDNEDYISLTDIARSQMQDAVIIKWLSLKSTIEYLGEWEILYNENFNCTEFGTIKNNSGSNNFVLSVKNWIEATNSIGITAKAGRYGATFAHKDIAFHFGMWISPRFQLLLIKEYQRLKTEENNQLNQEWNIHRTLAKINYKIHTDAIKENLIPPELTKSQINFLYASEADLLNVALFGMTASQWRDQNPSTTGNIRDTATIEQLVVLSNMESINSVLIHQQLSQHDRLLQLNKMAITQMKSLVNNKNIKSLKQ